MITLADEDVERVRAVTAVPGMAANLYAALLRRVDRWTETPGVTADGDSMQWWHVAWERLTDVAAAQRFEPDPRRAEWLRTTVLDICERPADDWVGPWFRQRTDPQRGMLETSHVGLGVVTVASLCPDLFGEAEHQGIRQALREKCQQQCRRTIDFLYGEHVLNNWLMIMLDGFGTVSAFLDDRPAVDKAVAEFAVVAGLYEDDSYGESLQYWNYASLHLAHLYEVLTAHDPALTERLDLSGYTRSVPWAVHSLMYTKPMSGWGEQAFPRSLNFGDSTVLFRPTADLLLHIAARARETYPVEAGLARWLFDRTYDEVELGPEEGHGFGFLNQFRWSSLLLLLEAADPLPPQKADLPPVQGFTAGPVAVRDAWENPATVLGVHTGVAELKTESHRHADYNSFILAHRQERFFADPGHCCYRLQAQQLSTSTSAHSTWSFRVPGRDEPLEQQPKGPSFTPSGRPRLVRQLDSLTVVRADAAAAYGAPIASAERTWIALLPHIVFVIDRITTAEDVAVDSHFVLNNRDGLLKVNEATPNRLVLRRGAAAVKFFRLVPEPESTPDGAGARRKSWGFMHDVYHPEPNQRGQGKEGSSVVYTYESPAAATEHLHVYSIVLDAEPAITRWHVKGNPADGFAVTLGPELRAVLRLPDGVPVVEDALAGTTHRID